MRIAYVTHTRFPTEKAHGHQVAHVCTALDRLGHAVTVIVPDLPTGIRQNAHTYYGLPKEVAVKRLPAFDALNHPLVPGLFAFLFSMRSYRKSLKNFLRNTKFDLLYARSSVIAPALVASGLPVALELHTLPRRGKRRFVALCNRCRRVICLTTLMKTELVAWGVHAKNVIAEGDAVDPDRFSKKISVAKAKQAYRLPHDRTVVGYAGSLVTFDNLQKGADILIRALARLKKQNIPVFGFIVGGPKLWSERYRKLAYTLGLSDEDICFHDAVSSKEVPQVLAACDVLAYPAPRSKHPFFLRDTSPLKLFEYMASGVPVVCANIPPVRDVANATVVRLVEAGSETSLAGGIKDIIGKSKEAAVRASNAKKLVTEHTWEKRMQRILKGLAR